MNWDNSFTLLYTFVISIKNKQKIFFLLIILSLKIGFKGSEEHLRQQMGAYTKFKKCSQIYKYYDIDIYLRLRCTVCINI